MSDDDMIRRADALALPHRLSPSLDASDGYYVSVDALRTIPAAHVAVKPLEWETDLGDGILTARAYGHIYRIIPTTEGGFFVPELLPLHFQNPSAAKAAVQSTHERHIAHLLTITPAPDPAQIRADALREAARTVWSEYDEKDRLIAEAVADERERCAKIADDEFGGRCIADKIRGKWVP